MFEVVKIMEENVDINCWVFCLLIFYDIKQDMIERT
jgi:hypothetical protein